jgi:hypothetical protein
MHDGYGVLKPTDVAVFIKYPLSALASFQTDWDSLPQDFFLKDGGRYRQRRHSCFVADNKKLTQVEHRPHYQPLAYNALHGGMFRMFEPMIAQTVKNQCGTHYCSLLQMFVQVRKASNHGSWKRASFALIHVTG